MNNSLHNVDQQKKGSLEDALLIDAAKKCIELQKNPLPERDSVILSIFSEIPKINSEKIAHLDEVKQIDANIDRELMFFNEEALKKLVLVVHVPKEDQDYYLAASIYLIISCYCFEPDLISKYFPDFMFILTRCVPLNNAEEISGETFFLLFKYAIENNFTFEKSTNECIIVIIENNRSLKEDIRPYLMKFLKKMLWSNDSANANKVIKMSSVLFADKRAYLYDIPELELALIPYALSFNINAVQLIAYISNRLNSDAILKTFNSIPAYLINQIKQSEKPIEINEFITAINEDEASNNLFGKLETFLDEELNPLKLLTLDTQYLASNLSATLKIANNQCVFNFFKKFTEEMVEMPEEDNNICVLIVYLSMILSADLLDMSAINLDKLFSLDIFSAEKNIFLNGSLPVLHNALRGQITKCILCASAEQISHFINAFCDKPFVLAELSLRLLRNKEKLRKISISPDTVFLILNQINVLRSKKNEKYSDVANKLAKISLFSLCAFTVKYNPAEYFSRDEICTSITNSVFDETLCPYLETLMVDTFAKTDVDVSESLISSIKYIFELSTMSSYHGIIAIFDKILLHNSLFAKAIQPALINIFNDRTKGNETTLFHALGILNSVSIYDFSFKPSFELLSKVFRCITSIDSNPSIRNELVNLIAKSTFQLADSPFIVQKGAYSLLFFANDYLDIDLFISLAKYSKFNVRNLHEAKFDYVLLRLLKGEDFSLYGMDIKVREIDVEKVMQYMELSFNEICTPEIISMLCSVIKTNPSKCIPFRFIKSFIFCKGKIGNGYEFGTVHPFAKIEGFLPEKFNNSFAISLYFQADEALFQILDYSIYIATFEDYDGNFIRFSIKNSAFLIEHGNQTSSKIDIVSPGLDLSTMSLLNMSITNAGQKGLCCCVKDRNPLQVIRMKPVVFTSKIRVIFGGSDSTDNENIVFGSMNDILIYDRSLENRERRPNDFIWSSNSLEEQHHEKNNSIKETVTTTSDRRETLDISTPTPQIASPGRKKRSLTPPPLPANPEQVVTYKSSHIIPKNCFDCFKEGTFITKFIKSLFATKENILNIAADGLKIMPLLSGAIYNSKNFFGIGTYISSHIIHYKCGSYNLYRSISNSIKELPVDAQQEFFDKILLSLVTWTSSPANELLKIVKFWNSQILFVYTNLLKRRSFVGRLFAEVDYFLTNYEGGDKDLIVAELESFIRNASQLRLDKSDEEMIISFTLLTKERLIFARFVRDIAKRFVSCTDDLRNVLRTLILNIDSEITIAAAVALNDVANTDLTTEALIISDSIRQDMKPVMCNYLIDNIRIYPRSVMLLCALALQMDGDAQEAVAICMIENSDFLMKNVPYNGGWFLFPIFLSGKLNETLNKPLYKMIAKIAIRNGVSDVTRCFALCEIITQKEKTEDGPTLCDTLLSAVAAENPTDEIAEFVFIIAATTVFYTINGEIHSPKLMKEFKNSPFSVSFKEVKTEYNSIDSIYGLKNFKPSLLKLTWRNDKNSENCLRIAGSYEKYNTCGKRLIESIEYIQKKKELPENNVLYEVFDSVFKRVLNEVIKIVMDCFESSDPNKSFLPYSVDEYEKIFLETQQQIAPKSIERKVIRDGTSCAPFCPMKNKLQRHKHAHPINCTRRYEEVGIKCELLTNKKTRRFYFSNDASCIYLDNMFTSKKIHIRNIIMSFVGTYSENKTYLELYTVDNQNKMILFDNNKAFVDSINQAIAPATMCIVPSKIYSLWLKGKLTNFELLMYLNILSGRSFNNPSLYPFIPKPFSDFDTLQPGTSLPLTSLPMPHIYSEETALRDIVDCEVLPADLFFDTALCEKGFPTIVKTPFEFIAMIRRDLESDSVTALLPSFIDKVWGVDRPSNMPHAKLFNTKIKGRKLECIKAPMKLQANGREISWAEEMDDGNIAVQFSRGRIIVTHPATLSVLLSYKSNVGDSLLVIGDTIHEFSPTEYITHSKGESINDAPIKGELFTSSGDNLFYVQNQTTILGKGRKRLKIETKCFVTQLAASYIFNQIVYATADGYIHFHSLRTGKRTNKSNKFHCDKILIARNLGFIVCKGSESIRVFDVNGNFVSDINIAAQKIFSVSFRGEDGIIAVSDSNVSFVYLCNTEKIKQVIVNPDVVYAYGDEENQSFVFINSNGVFEILPFSTLCL